MPDVECTNCYASISQHALSCPKCGHPNKAWGASLIKKVSIAVVTVFALLVLIFVGLQYTSSNDATSISSSTESSSVPVPSQESRFSSAVESFVSPYQSADTDIRKTNVRFERKEELQSFFLNSAQGSSFQNWVGRVNKLTTERDGEAYVSIKLPNSSVVLETANNSFSDTLSFPHTMISRDDPIYPSLMRLHIGDEVRFSGQFLRSEKPEDYVEEESLTEEGSMTEPDFIVRFSSINLASDILPQPRSPSVMQDSASNPLSSSSEPLQSSDMPRTPPTHRPVIIRNGKVISDPQTEQSPKPGGEVQP
jgi:hypothetical protein